MVITSRSARAQAAFHDGKVRPLRYFFGPPLVRIIYPQLRDFILEHSNAPKAVRESAEAQA
jgi:hypothetical protein